VLNPLEIGKMTIAKCEVKDTGPVASKSSDDIYVTNINPASFKPNHSISYAGEATDEKKAIGKSDTPARYTGTNPEDVSFDIVLDGTGVLRSTQLQMLKDGSTTKVVIKLLEKLKKVVYDFVGDEHQPNVVEIKWGSGVAFFGRLKSMNVDYTLFHPLGNPLRAKVSMSFRSYETPKQTSANETQESPDMTHHVTVRAGDTLPLLCEQIYKDPSRYVMVARYNRLDGFRQLTPGTELTFPPIR